MNGLLSLEKELQSLGKIREAGGSMVVMISIMKFNGKMGKRHLNLKVLPKNTQPMLLKNLI